METQLKAQLHITAIKQIFNTNRVPSMCQVLMQGEFIFTYPNTKKKVRSVYVAVLSQNSLIPVEAAENAVLLFMNNAFTIGEVVNHESSTTHYSFPSALTEITFKANFPADWCQNAFRHAFMPILNRYKIPNKVSGLGSLRNQIPFSRNKLIIKSIEHQYPLSLNKEKADWYWQDECICLVNAEIHFCNPENDECIIIVPITAESGYTTFEYYSTQQAINNLYHNQITIGETEAQYNTTPSFQPSIVIHDVLIDPKEPYKELFDDIFKSYKYNIAEKVLAAAFPDYYGTDQR